MTYKKVVAEMVRRSAMEWTESLLKEKNIPYRWVDAGSVDIEKDERTFLWQVPVNIVREGHGLSSITVGGTVDDMVGICCSVMWDAEKKKIVWMSVPETNEALGITEFILPGTALPVC